jgi:hypothetical protein
VHNSPFLLFLHNLYFLVDQLLTKSISILNNCMTMCVVFQIKKDNKGNLPPFDIQHIINSYIDRFEEPKGLPSLTIQHSIDFVPSYSLPNYFVYLLSHASPMEVAKIKMQSMQQLEDNKIQLHWLYLRSKSDNFAQTTRYSTRSLSRTATYYLALVTFLTSSRGPNASPSWTLLQVITKSI